jgi:hypothetical protein
MLAAFCWRAALPITLFWGMACAPIESLPSTADMPLLNAPAQAKVAVAVPPRVRPVDPPR